MDRHWKPPLLVVTRHKALVEYLREICPEVETAPVVAHVEDPAQVAGKIVLGVLPLHLAHAAMVVVEVPLQLRPEDRGRELSLDEVRARAGKARAYQVRRVGWQYPHLRLSAEARHWLDNQCRKGWLERLG